MNIGTLYALIEGDATKLLPSIQKEVEKAGDAAGKSMGQRLSASAVKAFTAAGAVAGTFVAGATQEFAKFQQGMNEVFTLLPGITKDAMSKMSGDVEAFARETGKLPEEVIPALYQAISAGIPPDNVFEFLRTANKAAVGGVTDLTTSVDGLTSVVNAYGKDVISAAQASDLMFTAVRIGKTTFGELSASLFNVVPAAAALGIGFGDVLAALTAMTAQGVPTAVATTQLRGVLVELSKEGTVAASVFEKVAGKSFRAFVAAGGNVQDALKLMEGEATRTGRGINDLFGSVEAGSAALTLTGKGTETFSANLGAMGDAAGSTDKAFGVMETGITGAAKRAAAAIRTFAIDAGRQLQDLGPIFVLFGPTAGRALGAGLGAAFGFAAAHLSGPASKLAGAMLKPFADLAAPIKAKVVAAILEAIVPATIAGTEVGEATAAGMATGIKTGSIGVKAALAGIAGSLAFTIPIAFVLVQAAQAVQDANIKDLQQRLTTALNDGSEAAIAEAQKRLNDLERGARASLNDSWLAIILGAKSDFDTALRDRRTAIEEAAVHIPAAIAQTLTAGKPVVAAAAAGLMTEAGERMASDIRDQAAAVAEAARFMAQTMPDAVGNAAARSAALAAALPAEIAEAIRSKRGAVASAMDLLRQAFKESKTPEDAGIIGDLTSKALIHGVKNHDPLVNAQAKSTKQILLDRLGELVGENGKLGKKAMDALNKAIHSKDPEVSHAAKAIKKTLENGFLPNTKAVGDKTTDALVSAVNDSSTEVGRAANALGRLIASELIRGIKGEKPAKTAKTVVRGSSGASQDPQDTRPPAPPPSGGGNSGGFVKLAAGGRYEPGVPRLTGELGPEIDIPDTGGTIVPNGPTRSIVDALSSFMRAGIPRPLGMGIPAMAAAGPAAGDQHFHLTVQGDIRARDGDEVLAKMNRLRSISSRSFSGVKR